MTLLFNTNSDLCSKYYTNIDRWIDGRWASQYVDRLEANKEGK